MTETSQKGESHPLDHPEVDALLHGVLHSLLAESDRGAVLVGTSYVDLNLKKLFELTAPAELSKKRLASILEYPGPLSTLAARTQVALLCRLIDRNLYDAIEALREIRNNVAHGPDQFVLGNHRDKLETIYNLGPGMPLWINRMACELLGRSFFDKVADIRLPDSDKPFFDTPADVLKYIDGMPNLLAPFNERLPRCELAFGIIFICALLIDDREAAVRVCGASGTWPRFQSAGANKSVEPTRMGLDD